MAHAGHVPRVRRAAHAALRHRARAAARRRHDLRRCCCTASSSATCRSRAVFEWNLLSLYAAFFLFVGHPEVSLFDIDSLPLALYLVVGAARAAADRQPRAVEGLLPGRDALLRRQLGVERVAVPRRQPPEARPAEARRAAAARAAASASCRRARRRSMDSRGMAFRSLHLQGRVPRPAAAEGDRRATRSRSTTTSTARPSPARSSAGTSARAISPTSACSRAVQAAVRLRGRRAARDHASSRSRSSARRCTGASSTRKRGLLEEGHAELDDLARRKPWDYGEV